MCACVCVCLCRGESRRGCLGGGGQSEYSIIPTKITLDLKSTSSRKGLHDPLLRV